MKKDIKWLKEEVGELNLVDTVFEADGVSYIDTAVSVMQVYDLIDELDELEVLSQDWIGKNVEYAYFDMFDGSGRLSSATAIIKPKKLQNLLVPKQGELEMKIHELIESYKQEEDAYSDPENGWISGFIEDLKNLVEKEPLYHALIKGHDVSNSDDIYWNYDKYDNDVFVSRLYPSHDNFLTELSKSEWNELGINDSNADFIKSEEQLN